MNERLHTYSILNKSLAAMTDNELEHMITTAELVHQGIGGKSFKTELKSAPIFIKAIPLSEFERQPKNLQSTANIFNLPLFYHYGVGSTGFGVWRELAAIMRVTDWVKTKLCSNFPMLFHWRVLENKSITAVTRWDNEAINKDVKYWNNSMAVKHRLEAIMNSKAHVVLFCEYFPFTLEAWLSNEIKADESRAAKAIDFVDQSLVTINTLMAEQEIVHFDAHFRNIVTDGKQLIFADFGLALSSHFDLSKPERDFLTQHINYDQAMSAVSIMHTTLSTIFGRDHWSTHLRRFLNSDINALPTFIKNTAMKYGAIALLMDNFFGALQKQSKLTPYPKTEIDELLSSLQDQP